MTQNKRRLERRFPAEWERHTAVLLAWPHKDTDWAYMLDEITECYISIIETITINSRVILLAPDAEVPRERLKHIDPERLIIVEVPTNDTWTRDYGPLTVTDCGRPRLCNFQFNGWGLKFAACHDNRVTERLRDAGLLAVPVENRLDFVLEGGSVESDGRGTLLTTSHCLMAPNRNNTMSRIELERYLKDCFGLNHILWLDNGSLAGDDTDSHLDTLARLAPDNTIIYTGCQDADDEHFADLQCMADQLRGLRTRDGLPYNLVELPLPDPIFDDEGNRLPATYTNYLVDDRTLIMPTYRQPDKDTLAARMLKISFPNHELLTVDCVPLIKQHGSLHCATMQLYPDTITL